MKSFPTFLSLLLIGVWTLLVQAQNENPSLVLPDCAKTCLATSVAVSSCSPTNQTCICTDEKLQAEVNLCVSETCTIMEGLVTLNLTSTECGVPVRDRRQLLKTLAITLGCISPLFVIQRIATRIILMKNGGAAGVIGEDDWFILATLVVGVPSTIIIVSGLVDTGGLGLDIWRLSPETITAFGKYFYATEIMYFAEVTLLKMSLLWFYLRIFPSRGVRRALWATIAFNIAYGLAFLLVGVLQCRPISYFWTKWDGEHQGTCVDINALAWSNAAISIALDFWMLAVPLSQLRNLRLHWKKKLGVALMFSVGTLVTVVSVLRLQSLVVFAQSGNPTWDSWEVTKWSCIEINVGIMCTCLPSLRVLLVRLFPSLGGTSAASKAYGPRSAVGAGVPSRVGTVSKSRPTYGVDSSIEGGAVARPKEAELRGGITMQRTYNVSYSDPEDQESLVQMQDLEPRRRDEFEKPGSSASSSTIAPEWTGRHPGRLP